jgi:transglutaminase-like putative cysteine protease
LLLVHLAVVGGFARLYADGSFLIELVVFVVVAHVLAVACRRAELPAPAAALVAVAGAALTATWLLFPNTTRFGLPGTETWSAAGEAVRFGRQQFEEVTAPAPVLVGFQLAAGIALWAAVWFADWAAYRLRATIEAVAPAAVIFVFASLLGSGEHQLVSAVAFSGAALLFVAGHRARRSEIDRAWLTGSLRTGPRTVLRAGVAVSAVGLLAGAVVGPRLPGTEADPVVGFEGSTDQGTDRTTISPIVDLRQRLVNQSDEQFFTVSATDRSYWRLTSLDRFDGRIWSSGGQFSPAEGRLGLDVGPDEGREIVQKIEIDALAAIWAPAAYQVSQLRESNEAVRWDPASSTLIVDDADATSDGLRYQVVSQVPEPNPDVLGASGIEDPPDIEERYEALPDGFPEVVARAAEEVTGDAITRYDQVIALQDWFRTEFTYSLEVPAGHGDDAMVAFLEARQGYCEQFAGTFAAMARSLGIPARVAVGFTPGDTDPDAPDRYLVLGKHAHAWPEVWFPDSGWVAFEPTPGRGIPGAEPYTGVPEDQDASDGGADAAGATTTAPPATAPDTTEPAATSAPPQDRQDRTAPVTAADEDGGGGPGPLARALLALGGIVVVGVAVTTIRGAVAARRWRAMGPAAAVLSAWGSGLGPVRWLTGQRPEPSETHREFARRVAAPLGDLDAALTELAGLATGASWNPAGATGADVARAGALATDLRHRARAQQSAPRRLLGRLWSGEGFGRTG